MKKIYWFPHKKTLIICCPVYYGMYEERFDGSKLDKSSSTTSNALNNKFNNWIINTICGNGAFGYTGMAALP
jgi:hypothetical protein